MDPIADMLISIKNAYMAKKSSLIVPYSKFKLEVVKVLEKEKFVGTVNKKDSVINIDLIYTDQGAKISQIKKVSKNGLRVYTKSKNIKSVRGGRGMFIVSTPKGVMSGSDAKNKKLGGEVICQLW